MEFQEQRPRTARPGTARPTTESSQTRLLTANAGSPYFESGNAAARPATFNAPVVEAGSLSRGPPDGNGRPVVRPGSHTERHDMQFPQMAPPRLLSRDENAAPREVVPTRPTTSQIYRSYTTPSQPSMIDVPDTSRQPSYPRDERPSTTSNMHTLEAIRQAAEESPPHTASAMPPPLSLTTYSHEVWSSAPTTDPARQAFQSPDPTESRPHTARPSTSATTVFADTLEHEIPPRRELVFNRPQSKGSGASAGSRPGTSSMTLPPLPKPKLAKESSDCSSREVSTSPVKGATQPRLGTASPLKRTFDVAEADGVTNAGNISGEVKGGTPDEPIRRHVSRMDELLYGRRPLTEQSTNTKVQRLSSLYDAPHKLESPPATSKSPTKSAQHTISPSRDFDSHDPTRNACASLKATSHDPREAAIEEYASQSREDREAALDQFMVEHLENSHFTTLCEDVENCWRRIALGL